jgi:hypothetical protein
VSAVTDTVRVAAPGNAVSQSFRDSMVVAKRNLIRMSRIPNPVRSCRSGSISPLLRDGRLDALKELVK